MKQPIEVRVDREVGAGYVRYTNEKIVGTRDIWKDGVIAADIDQASNIVGIELLSFDEETMAYARSFAAAHDLEFPSEARVSAIA